VIRRVRAVAKVSRTPGWQDLGLVGGGLAGTFRGRWIGIVVGDAQRGAVDANGDAVTWPLRKTDPFVLRKSDPGDAHSCVDSFPVAAERIVVGSLWTRGPRVWTSRGQQGRWPRLVHTSRRARAGPQDSSTSPQARHGQAPWPTTCRTELIANNGGYRRTSAGSPSAGNARVQLASEQHAACRKALPTYPTRTRRVPRRQAKAPPDMAGYLSS
jgi:hypothetical protein